MQRRTPHHRTPHQALNTSRLRVVTAVFFILGIGILTRLFNLQVLQNDRYEARAASIRNSQQTIDPERGQIYIHDGNNENYVIATNSVRYAVVADPRLVTNPATVAAQLAAVLGNDKISEDDMRKKLSRSGDPYEVIGRFVDESSAEAVRRLRLPGVTLEKETVRYYPNGPLFSHLTGFVAFKTDGALGQYGLEGEFDSILRGSAGRVSGARDGAGRLIATANPALARAEPGSSLVLTIDRATQFIVCQKLAAAVEKFQAASGSAIIVNPTTGDILALCNVPTFDPNNYNDVRDIGVFTNQALIPYEPGSVFKPLTMSGAIDAGAVTPQTTYNDSGPVRFGKFTINNNANKNYGVQTMVNVLEKSLNTGAMFAARQLGQDLFSQYVYRFGFGKNTGISLAGEISGDVSNIDRRGDVYLATSSFGQGLTVTPIQLAMAFSAIANGGTLLEPRLVAAVQSPNGEPVAVATKPVRRVITEDTARIIRAMMISVVRNGFGRPARVTGYDIGGKTGTAQIPDGRGGYGQDTNHTFVGIAPGDDPSFVAVLRLERPQKQSEATFSVAPLFSDIASDLLDLYGIPRQNK